MKKKTILKIAVCFCLFGTMLSCLDDFDELRENPNAPRSVPASLIFTNLTPQPTPSFTGTYEDMQYHTWIATDNTSVPGFTNVIGGDFGNYASLRNVDKMVEEAEKTNSQEYIILAKFYRARFYLEMTRRMGDIPFSESLKGVDNPQPKYDSQKSVYIQCLKWLDEANTELGDFIATNPAATLDGDLYFNGNLKQWQKLINVYTLRILVSLSKKANDSDVNVQGRFAAIIGNPSKYPLMTGLSDNAMFEYSGEEGFKQSYQPEQAVYKDAVVYASTYIDLLKGKEDPRLMVVADPTKDALDEGADEATVRADFDSYEGADISAAGSESSSRKLDGDFSFPNEDKYWNFVGQPGIWMSYWEQEFCIAEAAHRGWISANAADHYNNAITASMEWYGVESDKIADYIANRQPYITGDAGLTRLLEQKYIAFAENSGKESLFTYRRTGVPNFIFSSFNGLDPSLGEKYPVRGSYPSSERDNNFSNYNAALISQFGSENNDVDQVIWLLQD
ncbi:SusD/RagB family nutrient-binding outer membrane lipoprotein [Snuella sedimenti]|uniref:SusD/RagB family nutrient-binding outer membrane lipoprotein n=1 Tax=Snuella sedimenti TaxID=2798802 RepID=A0A8J7IU35_9FLAO|nr:SusD/RagB family nutrient-binding outer membrane lipoprotein [Snuella sedimenti]MBJ6368060.1 SusD/RagB family nutrient-binding outer membrane lipoprotein [Snuella sedimenti]